MNLPNFGDVIHTCTKHNYTGLNQYCPDCKRESKADGIVSYFTSPLAIREQYIAEIGADIDIAIGWHTQHKLADELLDYIHYLEGILCNGKVS